MQSLDPRNSYPKPESPKPQPRNPHSLLRGLYPRCAQNMATPMPVFPEEALAQSKGSLGLRA